jgi:hypothetical protein
MSGQSTVQDPPIHPRPGFPLSWNSAQPRPGIRLVAFAGINALIDVAGRRHRHHTQFIASATNTAVVRIIELTGAAELLSVHHDLEQCLRSLDQL